MLTSTRTRRFKLAIWLVPRTSTSANPRSDRCSKTPRAPTLGPLECTLLVIRGARPAPSMGSRHSRLLSHAHGCRADSSRCRSGSCERRCSGVAQGRPLRLRASWVRKNAASPLSTWPTASCSAPNAWVDRARLGSARRVPLCPSRCVRPHEPAKERFKVPWRRRTSECRIKRKAHQVCKVRDPPHRQVDACWPRIGMHP